MFTKEWLNVFIQLLVLIPAARDYNFDKIRKKQRCGG